MTKKTATKAVTTFTGWRYWRFWPFAALVKLWWRTLRVEMTKKSEAMLRDTTKPILVLLWHNQIFTTAEIRRRYRKAQPMYGLVSASKDGALLDAFFRLVGISTVRGSSSFRAREALKQIVKTVRAGNDFAITPDGPRGPIYKMSEGPLLVAKMSNIRIVLVALQHKKGASWRLKSWDRFHIPKPFSKVTFKSIYYENYEDMIQYVNAGESPVEFLQNKLMSLQHPDECKS